MQVILTYHPSFLLQTSSCKELPELAIVKGLPVWRASQQVTNGVQRKQQVDRGWQGVHRSGALGVDFTEGQFSLSQPWSAAFPLVSDGFGWFLHLFQDFYPCWSIYPGIKLRNCLWAFASDTCHPVSTQFPERKHQHKWTQQLSHVHSSPAKLYPRRGFDICRPNVQDCGLIDGHTPLSLARKASKILPQLSNYFKITKIGSVACEISISCIVLCRLSKWFAPTNSMVFWVAIASSPDIVKVHFGAFQQPWTIGIHCDPSFQVSTLPAICLTSWGSHALCQRTNTWWRQDMTLDDVVRVQFVVSGHGA